jgi:DNA-binding transcriptional MerR regulator
MPWRDKEIEKQYYSISEVAEMFDVNASLIRFWEKEFPSINPKKDRKGARKFTPKDIEVIRSVHHLVKRRGFTLEGARKHLDTKGDDVNNEAEIAERLERIRAFLLELKAEL